MDGSSEQLDFNGASILMARLPIVGEDDGTWGGILNEYLNQSLDHDGILKNDTVGAPQLRSSSVTGAAIANRSISSTKIADGAIAEDHLDADLKSKLNAAPVLLDGSVSESKLEQSVRDKLNAGVADGAITTAKLADGSVTGAKLAGYGRPEGVASLDSSGELPEEQVPARLSTTGVRTAIEENAQDSTGRKLSSIEVASGLEQRRARSSRTYTPFPVMPTPPAYTYGKGSGLAGVTIAAGGSGYAVGEQVVLAGGTATVPAIVYVVSVGVGGTVTGVSVHRPGVYSANPANPVSQQSSTGNGTGATFNVTMNGGTGSGITGSTFGPSSSGPNIDFYGNGPTADGGMQVGNDTQCWFEFLTDASILDLRFTAFNTGFQVFVNDERLSASGFSTDASGGRYILTLNFGNRAIRTIRVVGFNMKFVGALMPSSMGAWRPGGPRRPRAWVLGDSYTFGSGASDTTASVNNIMAECLGLDLITDGIGGAGWTGSTGGTPAQRINAKLATLNTVPELVFLDLGYNNAGSTPNVPAIQAGIDAAIQAVRSCAPGARIIVFGPATPQGATANLSTVRNTIEAKASEYGVDFISQDGWITMSNEGFYIGVDNVHPNADGHRYLGERKARAVAALLAGD